MVNVVSDSLYSAVLNERYQIGNLIDEGEFSKIYSIKDVKSTDGDK